MDERRLRLDPFAFALGALALLTLGFISASNGGALVMCGLCFAGLLAARFVGFSNLALVPLAGGLVILLWMLWVDPPLDSHSTGAIAHAVGGLLVGWAVAEFLRGRADWPMWAIGAVGGVLALTIAWELGEWVADRALTTDSDAEQARLGDRHRLRHPRRSGRNPAGDAAARAIAAIG